jgi:beta-N-acetylhexosaminidase
MKIRIYRNIAIPLMIILSTLLLGSCSLNDRSSNDPGTPTGNLPAPTVGTALPEDNDRQEPVDPADPDDPAAPDDPADQKIRSLLDSMTLEEKIGQMLFLAYRQDKDGRNVLKMDNELEEYLSRYKPGGFVLFAENLESIDQTVSLINNLQIQSKIPLFVSVDEEGGIVTRLNKAPGLHSTVMPNAYTIGLTGKPEYAYKAARAIAAELLSLGFNMNFAPVADIFSNPVNKVIGKRAYGTEPQLVSQMVRQAVAGFAEGRIIPVLKHFPGHGDTAEDTHTGAAVVEHDLERLTGFELMPFREGIEAGADAVMVAHIILPKLMEEPVPATISKEVVTGLLREKLMFDGVIITDALEMSAVSSFYDDEEAAVMAVLAGIDMLLMPSSAEKTFGAILYSVRTGVIPEERIDESVYRILRLKEKYGILDNSVQGPDPDLSLGSPEHQALAGEIERAAKQR